jgi:hypothetical protein
MSTSTVEIQGLILFANNSTDAWSILESSFSSQTTNQSMVICGALHDCKKLGSSIVVYYNKVKSLVYTLMSIGQPLTTAEFFFFRKARGRSLLRGNKEEYR